MRRSIRTTLFILAILLGAVIMYWRLPGRLINPAQLDYVRAFDDPATKSILIAAAFDGGSWGVIDSCGHEWRGTDVVIEMRSKTLISRDGRTARIAAFRVPYSGTPPVTVQFRGATAGAGVPVTLIPAVYAPPAPVIDSLPR